MPYYARSENITGEKQFLRDHLRQVSQLAERFSAAAQLPSDLGRWAGLLHDLGKYSDEFQIHLAQQDHDLVEHACHGAAIAASANAIEVAFAVAAHHSGLGSKTEISELLRNRDERTASLTPRAGVLDRARRFAELAIQDGVFQSLPGRQAGPTQGDELGLELRTRMLLSCLADADRLDAQRWATPGDTATRTIPPLDAPAALSSVLQYIETRRSGSRGAQHVNTARDEVLAAALAAAESDSGFFSLTVPTGGGKTLASLAFALRHAQVRGQGRIIFVLPFLAIIEQNADVIRRAAGGQTVLEHHSGSLAIDPGEDQQLAAVRRRLLSENWDAPIVVTTTVQFFHSLFSNHPTALRKVHNIANSIVVFDEAQTFPPGMMRPLVGMLRQLKDDHGCSFVFCTATQPALSQDIRGQDGAAPLIPHGEVREIATDPAGLFARLKRVNVRWPATGQVTSTLDVAAAMASSPGGQALGIVNTKKQAASLYRALREHELQAIHLSTRMCAAHRREVFRTVRTRLQEGRPCLVASTQLIEAGVDVDFPAVWRAMAPLDSIAQSAGRCNREGKLPAGGTVTVFAPEDDAMPGGTYRRGANITTTMLQGGGGILDIDDPDSYVTYFVNLYNRTDLDVKQVVESRRNLQFPDVAEDFRIIDEDTRPVLVPFGDGERWCTRVLQATAATPVTRGELRRMQPFIVALYPRELTAAVDAGVVLRDEATDLHVLVDRSRYDAVMGLVLPNDPLQD